MSSPIDVTIDLSNAAAGTAATLYFDLLGFGQDNSRYSIKNVQVEGEAALSWHNSTLPEDTDGNGQVTPLDALLIINEITREP